MSEHSKPVMVPVTDPREIFSIRRDGFADIIGGKAPDGSYWAYKESVDAWRERQRLQTTDPGEPS